MKYFSHKFQADGFTWDSKLEYQRWKFLNKCQQEGIISQLQRQTEYTLIPKQTKTIPQFGKRGQPIKAKTRVLELPVTYHADFQYLNQQGQIIVEDTKSKFTKTKDYIIKRKLMLFIHGIRIAEVQRASEPIQQ